MPTYEYECDACGHRFDLFQSITAKPVRKCPECGRLKVRRLIGTGGAVIFKGGGFYETDYRSEGYRKAEEAERKSGEKKPAASKESGTGDAKSSGDAAATSASGDSSSKKPAEAAKPSATPASSGSGSGGGGTPAKKSVGKRHAREGRGAGNLARTAKRAASSKATGRKASSAKSPRRTRG